MKKEKEMKCYEETKEDISFDVRPSTVFYEQWYKTISSLPPRERDRAYKYIFEYAFYGIEPERDKTISMSYVLFGMAKPNIDSAQKRYDAATENGQKGGRPTKVTPEVREKIIELRKNGMTQKEVASELSLSLKTIQRVEKDKSQNHNYNVNDNVNDNDNNNSVASGDDNTIVANAPTVEDKSSPTASDEANQTETEIFSIVNESLQTDLDIYKDITEQDIRELEFNSTSHYDMFDDYEYVERIYDKYIECCTNERNIDTTISTVKSFMKQFNCDEEAIETCIGYFLYQHRKENRNIEDIKIDFYDELAS